MYLEELIENVELESDKFECKSRLNREDVVGWLKSIAGFANASGGDFYIFLLCNFFYHIFSLFHYFSFIEFLPSPDLSYSKLLSKPYFSPDTDFLPDSPTPL